MQLLFAPVAIKDDTISSVDRSLRLRALSQGLLPQRKNLFDVSLNPAVSRGFLCPEATRFRRFISVKGTSQ
jgi:hypothetical protein